ncbi:MULTISPECIES: hypothetical protein [unclassified Janthinobacterium]|nr:hypothetical protein [Janthinobacterium sp. CG_23.4]MCL6485139.1 hypothetical protein [Janthinobacterium lividum]MDH6156698.1 hypothetical protein [Janthinobacterium sp. CG_23.4]
MKNLHNNILAAHKALALNWRLAQKLVFTRHPRDAAAAAVSSEDSQGRASDARVEKHPLALLHHDGADNASAEYKPETAWKTDFAILFLNFWETT